MRLFLLSALWVVSFAHAACDISSSGVAFGTYLSPMQRSDVLSSGTITVACDSTSTGIGYKMKLKSANKWVLTNDKDKLNYNLFADSARTIVWDDGPAFTYQGVTSLKGVIAVYGKTYANQNALPGAYSDSISVQIVF